MSRQPPLRRLQTLWLWVTAVLLFCSVAALILGTIRFARQAGEVAKQQALQRTLDAHALHLQQVLIAVDNAETGQRGYLLTGKTSYLIPYNQALQRLPALLDGMDTLGSLEPGLSVHTTRLRAVADQKLAELAQTIQLRDAGNAAAALQLVLTDQGQRSMDELRGEASLLERAIESAHRRVDVQVSNSLERSSQLAALVVTVLALFIVLCTLQVGLLLASRTRSERALARNEAFLNRVGHVAGVGGWELNLQDDAVLWSDQSRRILDVEEHVAPTVETLFAFFASEGYPILRDAILAARYQGTPFDIELPLVTHTGTPIIVRFQGEAERDGKGQPNRIVGSLQDITARKQIEEHLRDLTEVVESTSDFVVKTDWKGLVTYLNPAARACWSEFPDEALLGRSFAEFNAAETSERFMTTIRATVKEEGVWIGETTVLVGDRRIPVDTLVIGHRDEDGRIARYSAVMRDISAIIRARNETARQTATLSSVVEAIPAMVAVFDAQFRYRMVNRAFERWRGVSRDAVIGRGVAEMFGQDEFDRSWPWAQRALAGETVQYEKDYPGARNKHLSVTYMPLRLLDGTIDGMIGVAQDITQQIEEKSRLLDLSERDPLTGLLNRAGLHSYLASRIQAGAAASLALLYIDLDHFKPVNDTYGHAVGDEVLLQFGQRMQLIIRGSDAVARLGGDEFAIALTGVARESGAHAVADKVLAAASTAFVVRGITLEVGASVGVALGADDASGMTGLIERADAKLYEAKAAGRRCKA